MSYMTLTLVVYLPSRVEPKEYDHKVSSLGVALEKLQLSCGVTNKENTVPNKLKICNVLADSPQTLQRTTYSSAYDLLTELPGKLVVLNGINVPRKLQRFPPTTVYEAAQVYRTKTGEWKLVCERFNVRNPGVVVVPVTSLVLLQTPVPPTPSNDLRVVFPAPSSSL
jgi:hypothetical protein